MICGTNLVESLILNNQLEDFSKCNSEIKPLRYRLKKYVRLGVVSILCFVMMIVQDQINVAFIGNISDPAKLAGIGLGNMVLNLVPYALLFGVNTALETFVSQAYGRQDLRECGLYLHRSMLIICCIFVPVAISMFYASNVLISLGINE